MMTAIWLAVTIVAAVVEAIVPALVSIWFVVGGLLGLVCSLAGGPEWMQVGLFLVGSVAALLLTRPLAKRLQKEGPQGTNADRVLGAQAVVTEGIDNLRGQGRVQVLGNSWAARSAEPQGKIPVGAQVVVERIEGVKLIVAVKAGSH